MYLLQGISWDEVPMTARGITDARSSPICHG